MHDDGGRHKSEEGHATTIFLYYRILFAYIHNSRKQSMLFRAETAERKKGQWVIIYTQQREHNSSDMSCEWMNAGRHKPIKVAGDCSLRVVIWVENEWGWSKIELIFDHCLAHHSLLCPPCLLVSSPVIKPCVVSM